MMDQGKDWVTIPLPSLLLWLVNTLTKWDSLVSILQRDTMLTKLVPGI